MAAVISQRRNTAQAYRRSSGVSTSSQNVPETSQVFKESPHAIIHRTVRVMEHKSWWR
jgi:hypothetical protein